MTKIQVFETLKEYEKRGLTVERRDGVRLLKVYAMGGAFSLYMRPRESAKRAFIDCAKMERGLLGEEFKIQSPEILRHWLDKCLAPREKSGLTLASEILNEIEAAR